MAAAVAHGFLLSLGLILPLGVQNTFVFLQGTVQPTWLRGLPVVLTAAVCDTLLIVAAVSGVSLAVLSFAWFHTVLAWGGLVFLAYMGWVTWRSDPGGQAAVEQVRWPVRRQVAFAATVSLLNPHAIFDTVAVIGTTSLRYGLGTERLAFTLTCVGVSWLWFTFLMTAGRAIGALGPTPALRRWLSRISALIMWGVGLQLAYQTLAQ